MGWKWIGKTLGHHGKKVWGQDCAMQWAKKTQSRDLHRELESSEENKLRDWISNWKMVGVRDWVIQMARKTKNLGAPLPI